MSEQPIWYTLLNSTGEDSIKQHAFVGKEKRNRIGKRYEGNISLCGRIVATKEGPEELTIDEIKPETINSNTACRMCLMIECNSEK